MNILLCNERFLFRFGVDRVLLLLGEGLSQRGHSVSVMANRLDRTPLSTFANKIVEVPVGQGSYLNLNEATALWLQENLDNLFKESEKPDVVVIGGWPFFASVPLFTAWGAKTIFLDCGAVPLDGMEEGQRITQNKLRMQRAKYLPQIDQIIAISKFIETSQSKVDSAGVAKTTAMLLGADHMQRKLWSDSSIEATRIDLARIRKIKRAGRKILLNLGRWEPGNYKNSELLFEILRELKKRINGLVALVLSEPTGIVIPADLTNNIIALGCPSDEVLQEVMMLADAGVSVSMWEGFNLPLAEMQWLERPAVVFNTAAHPEVVMHAWFLADNPEQMTAKLAAVLTNNALSHKDMKAAYEKFRRNFSWDAFIDQFESCFFELLPLVSSQAAADLEIFVDVSCATRDPANSGVIRVTRSFCCALQRICKPVFLVWDDSREAYVFPNKNEYLQLSAFNGPAQLEYHSVSSGDTRADAEGQCATAGKSQLGWLFLTETVKEESGKKIRKFAARTGLQTAAIFYDAIPVIRPDLCADKATLQNHSAYMAGLAECAAVFPISAFSSRSLTEYWRENRIPAARTMPTSLAGEFKQGARKQDAGLFDSNRIRILCVSTVEPRKNHATLLAALEIFSSKWPLIDWSLTLIGNRYAGGDELATMVEQACQANFRIRWLGVADDEELREEYEACSFTVYPSVIEGYGMPIVESMWHGKPCICYDRGVMAELAKDGGCLTVDVLNAEKISVAIHCLSSDRVLYDQLANEAVQRPIKSWNQYSMELLSACYRLTPAAGNLTKSASRREVLEMLESKLEVGQQSDLKRHTHEDPEMQIVNSPRRAISWSQILYPNCLTDDWQMNDSEKLGLTALLHRHKPRCCIEIGTYKGGSLSLISQYADMIFSIDIDPTVADRFGYFKNTSFLTGPSQDILPILFSELNREGISVDFILIDGDHSADGVKRDLELIFQYVPKTPLLVMMHDSFNPDCRRGMLEANWNVSKYLQWVDLDFIPGRLVEHGGGGHGELWGGLGCALFAPEQQLAPVSVSGSARELQSWAARYKSSQ